MYFLELGQPSLDVQDFFQIFIRTLNNIVTRPCCSTQSPAAPLQILRSQRQNRFIFHKDGSPVHPRNAHLAFSGMRSSCATPGDGGRCQPERLADCRAASWDRDCAAPLGAAKPTQPAQLAICACQRVIYWNCDAPGPGCYPAQALQHCSQVTTGPRLLIVCTWHRRNAALAWHAASLSKTTCGWAARDKWLNGPTQTRNGAQAEWGVHFLRQDRWRWASLW